MPSDKKKRRRSRSRSRDKDRSRDRSRSRDRKDRKGKDKDRDRSRRSRDRKEDRKEKKARKRASPSRSPSPSPAPAPAPAPAPDAKSADAPAPPVRRTLAAPRSPEARAPDSDDDDDAPRSSRGAADAKAPSEADVEAAAKAAAFAASISARLKASAAASVDAALEEMDSKQDSETQRGTDPTDHSRATARVQRALEFQRRIVSGQATRGAVDDDDDDDFLNDVADDDDATPATAPSGGEMHVASLKQSADALRLKRLQQSGKRLQQAEKPSRAPAESFAAVFVAEAVGEDPLDSFLSSLEDLHQSEPTLVKEQVQQVRTASVKKDEDVKADEAAVKADEDAGDDMDVDGAAAQASSLSKSVKAEAVKAEETDDEGADEGEVGSMDGMDVYGSNTGDGEGTKSITLEEILAGNLRTLPDGGWESDSGTESGTESDGEGVAAAGLPALTAEQAARMRAQLEDDSSDDELDDEALAQDARFELAEAKRVKLDLGRCFGGEGDVMEERERKKAQATALELFALELKKKELKPVDHATAEYLPIRKNFYVVPKALSNLTEAEVKEKRLADEIKVRGVGCPPPVDTWQQCGLPEKVHETLLKSYGDDSEPFAVQRQCLPALMSGRDVIGIAKTGSGKTLAFVLPMLRHIMDQPPLEEGEGPVAMILAPARELALQIYKEVRRFASDVGLRCVAVYGGAKVADQIADLKRGAEVVTPAMRSARPGA
ncbi:hypothetical protein M885DRAFT_132361 [Pelagophyceae sp. CCMP2097]|nr:hypothetical protein M885DRAFT_132361 [Pelagophyceae sp. CCMP2097]